MSMCLQNMFRLDHKMKVHGFMRTSTFRNTFGQFLNLAAGHLIVVVKGCIFKTPGLGIKWLNL